MGLHCIWDPRATVVIVALQTHVYMLHVRTYVFMYLHVPAGDEICIIA